MPRNDTMPTFRIGEKVMVRHKGKNVIGKVGMIMSDGLLIIDFDGAMKPSLAYWPWQVSKME